MGLVDKAEVIKTIDILIDRAGERYYKATAHSVLADVKGIIGVMDTVSVDSISKQGEWNVKYPLRKCNLCGEVYSELGGNGDKAWRFCPSCGARMDEGGYLMED